MCIRDSSNTYGANAQKADATAINSLQVGVGKLLNSLDIAQSVLTGKVVNFTPTRQEMRAFIGSINTDLFKEGNELYIPISDMRHEYQDENIYVMNGKVYDNTKEKATDLTGKEYQSMGEHGGGYAQMIIPEDGSAPYLHYYDYNYENLNNIADVAAGGGVFANMRNKIDQGWENAFLKSLSNIIHQLRPDNTSFSTVPDYVKRNMISYFTNFETVYKSLKTNSSLEGWPPGIHGAALTDFKVPLDQLPEETRKMITSHPLYWSDERIANMSYDEISQQMKEVTGDYENEYYDKYMKYIRDPKQVPPEFAEAIKKVDGLFDEYTKVDAKIREMKDNLNVGKRRDSFLYIKNNKAAEAGEKEYDRVLKILHDYYDDQKAQGYENFDQKYVDKLAKQVRSVMLGYLKSAGAKFESGYGGAIITDPNATYEDFVYPNGRVVKGLGGELRDAQAELDEIDESMLSILDGYDEDFIKSINGKFIQISKGEQFGINYSDISSESWIPGRKGTGNVPGGYRLSLIHI